MAVDATAYSTQTLASLTGASAQPASSRMEQKTLGQDDFFKLLTTQLASQDPLKPMEDTAFIAQMAQFSQLEMTNKMTKSLENFTSAQQLASAQSYLDRTVEFSDGTVGHVSAVKDDRGTLKVYADNQKEWHEVSTIRSISL